ncbi:hypothetical protein C8R46DRAFT_1197664 [Mycena filopes]|nr:hypothetical protein C8R46DRAFT_1197664 [Mycena filopes]
MANLISIPTNIRHRLLSILPDFIDLGAMILTHRAFHATYEARRNSLLNDVARNLLGCLFGDALLLARAQELTYQLGDGDVARFSTNRVLLLVNNDYVVKSLERVMFGLLKRDTEKFKPFAPSDAFLEALAPAKLMELNNFLTGISDLICAIRGQPPESDADWHFVDSVLSTGPENIWQLWLALQTDNPDFTMELEGAGSYDEAFFTEPFIEAKESKRLDDVKGLAALEPIFDDDNRIMNELLGGARKRARTRWA